MEEYCQKSSDSGLMDDIDTDMEFPQHLGMDNDALDINDINFMDENILKSILPDSPPDSGSERCQLSPHYSLSPDMSDTNGPVTLYSDPVLYQPPDPGYQDPGLRYPGLYDRPHQAGYIPDISAVDYDQPLQIVESAQVVTNSLGPEAVIMEQTTPVRNAVIRRHVSPVPATVVGVNNPGAEMYREAMVKQEPLGSPPAPVTKPMVNKRKKRGASEDIDKLSEAGPVKIKSETSETDQVLHFTAFQPTKWRETYNPDFQILKTPMLKVSADKGFNFSLVDDAFIAQKKNHFQLSCQVNIEGEHTLITTDLGCQKIEYFQLNFYGIKKEAPEQRIKIEQSQTDRSRKKFYPMKLNFQDNKPIRVTEGRLHFSETTLNNMRKKGKPNPEQKYFQLVVSLEAVVSVNGALMEIPVCSLATEKIIVRASNPGLFEPEQEVSWSKNSHSDTVYHMGKVGIGTDHSKEALTVQGNIQVAGNVLSPSDIRLKQNINTIDTKKQLENVQKIKVVEFKYKPEYLSGFSESEKAALEKRQIGVIAQDVGAIIPDAVESAGDVTLANGRPVNNMLIVNKDRLFLENIGAVRELSKVTDNLGHRIDELETHTVRMSTLSKFGSIKSTRSVSSTSSEYKRSSRGHRKPEGSIFRNRWIQGAILALVSIMTVCLLAMAILYILDYQRRTEDEDPGVILPPLSPNSSITFPPVTVTTSRPTSRLVTTRGVPGRVTTHVLGHVTTSRPVSSSQETVVTHRLPKKLRPAPIGRPHDCSAPDVLRECDSFCCAPSYTLSGPGPGPAFSDNIDNNISAPGAEVMTYNLAALTEDEDEEDSVIQDGLSNVLDVTGERQTSEQTRLVESDTIEEAEQTDITAVRRAVEDETNGAEEENLIGDNDDNADNDLVAQRSQNSKTRNFIADPREEAGEESLKDANKIVDRLSRNQRNFDEAANSDQSVDGDSNHERNTDDDLNDVSLNENEIFNDDESVNSTNDDTSEESRSGSGVGQGKKSINLLGTTNDLKSSRLKKPFKNSPNVIEDSVKPQQHKNVADIVKNLRRKRNVPSSNSVGDKEANICLEPLASVKVKTRAGEVNLTSEYCENCSVSGNCSFSVPLSRYMTDTAIGLVFTASVTRCEVVTPPVVCPGLNDINQRFAEQPQPSPTSSLGDQGEVGDNQVSVEAHKLSHYKFRMLRDSSQGSLVDLCHETRLDKFVEFNFKFYRDCRD